MPIFDLFWTMLWFFLFFIWIWLLITIFGDIFRSGMSGLAKAGWVIFVIVLPMLGCLIYLVVNGSKMEERAAAQARQAQEAQQDYIRSVAGSSGSGAADELTKLAQLKDRGVITDEEFQSQKAKLLA
jgi:hypothetical protein